MFNDFRKVYCINVFVLFNLGTKLLFFFDIRKFNYLKVQINLQMSIFCCTFAVICRNEGVNIHITTGDYRGRYS